MHGRSALIVLGIAAVSVVGEAAADSGARCKRGASKLSCELQTKPSQRQAELLRSRPQDALETVVATSHACARLSGGKVSCWGSNGSGQLGDGTAEDRDAPVAVRDLRDVVELALGSAHTCARRADGEVLCWGMTDGKRVPTVVRGVAGAREIASGWAHTCARLADGTVSCWGYGRYGQLGDGAQEDRRAAVQAQGVVDAEEIIAGEYYSCARAKDRVWCWGNGWGGEDGTEARLMKPALVKLPAPATALVAGASELVAVFASKPTMRCSYKLREESDESTAELGCREAGSLVGFTPRAFVVGD